MDIKDRIKERRLHLKWSHEQLANQVSQLEGLKKPLTWQTVQQWENGTTMPRPRRLEFVAAALGMPLDELMGSPASKAAQKAVQEQRGEQAAPWPFQVITREQIAQLSSRQLAGLEKVMVSFMLQPFPVDWRTVAVVVAEEADQKNKSRPNLFNDFVRAVDARQRMMAAAVPAESAPA